jgi:hypothetical protein
MFKTYSNSNPRFMRSKWICKCKETGRSIDIDDAIMIYNTNTYSEHSKIYKDLLSEEIKRKQHERAIR